MIRQSVRWYLAYSLCFLDIEEIMNERGFKVDHSTIQRWEVLCAATGRLIGPMPN